MPRTVRPLTEILRQRGLSVRELARRTKIDNSTFYDWWHGVSRPTKASVQLVALVLGLSYEDTLAAIEAEAAKRRRQSR